MTWLVALALLATPPEVPQQTRVFYNARLALKDDKPVEVLRLWLLRNSLVQAGLRPTLDAHFASAVWVALSRLALCPDGLATDANSARLWPLAVHNLVVALMQRPVDELPSPFEAFDIARQQRLVSLSDTLDNDELKTVTFTTTACAVPQSLQSQAGLPASTDFSDRLVAGRTLRAALVEGLQTIDQHYVPHRAVIEARLFDLDLALLKLEAERKQQLSAEAAQRTAGQRLSPAAVADAQALVAGTAPLPAVLRARLEATRHWSVDDWLRLNTKRREFLFAMAGAHLWSVGERQALAFRMLDALAERGEGDQVRRWVGFLAADSSVASRSQVFAGARGERLLALDGFSERAAIALHRGVAALESGQTRDALRAFAIALSSAELSREANSIQALSRRWLSFTLGQYAVTPDLVASLKALVPRQEYNAVIEDLVWRAALASDSRSFELLMSSSTSGGSFEQRMARLVSLAQGSGPLFLAGLQKAMREEPSLTLRFVRTLLEHIEAEEPDVRLANRGMLRGLVVVLDEVAGRADASKSQQGQADALAGRVQAVLEALGEFVVSPKARARGLAPTTEAFVGNLRLAPADALPWPFAAPSVEAPTPFAPLLLQPVEWRVGDDELIFGWDVREP